MIKIFNTATGRKEEFRPVKPNHVGIYACGMTVQSEPHMGHFRTFTSFDAVRRFLLYRGWDVVFVSNFTDIDDKIIQKSQQTGLDWREIARKNEEKFHQAADALNILPPDHMPRATQHIQEIIEMVEQLVQKQHAYIAGGDVYFSVQSFSEYGKLSHKNLDQLVPGARVEPGQAKKHPGDFVLWKGHKPGEPYWYSPWGRGRPGWHIECSAMSTHYLGQPFDIHGGGTDLIFPHHENEIAQAEAARGKTFVNYWMHCGMLNISGEKMSKSTGKYFSVHEALKEFHPMALRLYFLKHHYRSMLNFTEEALKDAQSAWETLSSGFSGVQEIPQISSFSPDVAKRISIFNQAMEDDFNTPKALAQCFGLAGEINSTTGQDRAERVAGLALLLRVLGFKVENQGLDELANDLMRLIIDLRAQLRHEKNFKLADSLRDKLAGLGVILKDTPDGTVWSLEQ